MSAKLLSGTETPIILNTRAVTNPTKAPMNTEATIFSKIIATK